MSRSYSQLVSQARVNLELFREDIQNRGTVNIGTMLPRSSSSRLCRTGSSAGVYPGIVGGGIQTSGAVASVVDTTAPFSVELALRVSADSYYPIYQANAGGWTVVITAGGTIGLNTYTAALATARRISAVVGSSANAGLMPHAVLVLGSASGQCYLDGSPITTVFTAGTAVLCAPTLFLVPNVSGRDVIERVRVWEGELDAAESKELYRQYLAFHRPSMV